MSAALALEPGSVLQASLGLPALGWLAVPLAPLFAALLMLCWRDRITPWLWLSCVPALLAAWQPPAALPLPALWPGAEWGSDDLVTRAFLGFTALLWACASVYAGASHRHDPRRLRFFGFWLLSMCGNLLLVMAQDGASFYVGFTLMSLSAYALVVHQGGTGPRQAGRLYLQLAIIGEMLLYAGLLLRIFEAGGTYGFADWQTAPIGGVTAVLLLLGFGIKAGFWPLHVWLPLAHPAAPAAASAVLSGAMIKAGILGLWRFLPGDDPLLMEWAGAVFAVGMFSAFYGVALGLLQATAKAALAYSSVSQVGYLLAILALAWQQPQERALWGTLLALYAVHHGLAKGALFMGAGLASRHRLTRLHGVLMLIPALALTGLPLSSGAAVKTLFKARLEESLSGAWLPLLTLGSFATALLLARALWLMVQSQKKAPATPPAPALLGPWALLCLMPLLAALVWPEMRAQGWTSAQLATTWALLWPLLVAAMLVVLVMRRQWRIPRAWTRLPNPARALSLRLYRRVRHPQVPPLEPRLHAAFWRAQERRWNRFWQNDPLAPSVWVLAVLLLWGWVGFVA
jgi:hydrogenase-4 component B